MEKKYSGFTLVEMLIVMGILIILMAVGITAGRFAINRANDVAHQNAADQIYTALQAYYTDNRNFPNAEELAGAGTIAFAEAISETGILYEYMSEGEFTGGTEATFFYYVEPTMQQEVLVCVSLGGINDEVQRGHYCTGNAFGADGGPGATILQKNVEPPATPNGYPNNVNLGWTVINDWNGEAFVDSALD